jgi:hypothetical protein
MILFFDRSEGDPLDEISLQEWIDEQDRDHGDEDLGSIQGLVRDLVQLLDLILSQAS